MMSDDLPQEPEPNQPRRLTPQQLHELGLENIKAELTKYQVNVQRSLESARAASKSGAEAIKATTLINGGAAVAMLAFVGHLASIQASAGVIMSFAQPLATFVVGALLGVVASGVTYLSQISYETSLSREFRSIEARSDNDEEEAKKKDKESAKWRRVGRRVNLVAILTVVAALVCFALGCWAAYRSFQSGFTPMPFIGS